MHINNGMIYPDSRFAHDFHKWERHANKVHEIAPLCDHGVAIDVGANIGLWSVRMAEYFDRVWAFEPEPENYECLVANIGERKNILPLNLGVSDRMQLVDMIVRGAHYGRVAKQSEDGDFRALLVAIDQMGLETLDLLKVDVDGTDYQVLQGAEETIRRCKPAVCVEIKGPKRDTQPIRDFLLDLGYDLELSFPPDEVYIHADKR